MFTLTLSPVRPLYGPTEKNLPEGNQPVYAGRTSCYNGVINRLISGPGREGPALTLYDATPMTPVLLLLPYRTPTASGRRLR